MGLDKALESVDRVMMDLEENHGEVTNIQNSLATSFDANDDFDWEAEMDMLLHPDTYVVSSASVTRTEFSPPATLNAISQAISLETVTSAVEAPRVSDAAGVGVATELAVMA